MTDPLTAAERRGVVTRGADGRQLLEFRRSWPDPIDDVWSALTEPDRMARWIGTYEGERQPGGTGTLAMAFEEGDSGGQQMRIVECDPPRRLVVESVDVADFRLEVDLLASDGRTELVFRQWFAPDAQVADWAGGWHWYLDKLDAVVTGGPQPPEWEAFWAAVGPAYRPSS